MKKLLVLSLVLGIASLATAGLSLEVTGNNVSVLLDAGSMNLIGYELAVRVDGGLLDASAVNLNPSGHGWMAAPAVVAIKTSDTQFVVTAGDIPMFGGQGLSAPNYVLSGLTFQGSKLIELVAIGDVNIGGETTTGGVVLDSFVVPEPATLALLGLGALVLRRKK